MALYIFCMLKPEQREKAKSVMKAVVEVVGFIAAIKTLMQ